MSAGHRVRLTLLGELRRLVQLARRGADREHPRAVVAGAELASLLRADPREDPRLEAVVRAARGEGRAAGQHGVDLLLRVGAVVVCRILAEPGREVHHREPERTDAEARANPAETAAEDRLEILQ